MRLRGFTDKGKFNRPGITEYVKRMSSESEHVVFDDRVAKLLERQGIQWEHNPRSIYRPKQLWKSLERYGSNFHNRVKIPSDVWRAGVDFAWRVFARPKEHPKLSPLSIQEIEKAVDKSKSSGLPFLRTKGEVLPYAIDRMKQVIDGVKVPSPCIAYARTQKSDKTRLVWGYPLEMTLLESKYARPLIDHFLSYRTPMALGLSKPALGGLLSGLQRRHLYALDFSKFDASIPAHFIETAFSILETWFDVDPVEWKMILNYFIHTPIVMPDGHLYVGKDHGVPSGSYFTQLIDSIVNIMLIGMISHKFRLRVYWREVLVLGDDSIFCTDRKVKLQHMAAFVSALGFKLNVLKSMVDKVHFLGAEWRRGLPDLDVTELATKAVYPERFRKYTTSADHWNVLLSYASQYLSGYRFVRNVDYDTSTIPYGGFSYGHYMTGSDMLHMQFVARKVNPRHYFPTIQARMLL